MKKLLFILSFIISTGTLLAGETTINNSDNEAKLNHARTAMVQIVDELRPTFNSNLNYREFINSLDVREGTSLTANQDAMMRDAFNFLKNGTENSTIMTEYNGQSIIVVVDNLGDEPFMLKCRICDKIGRILQKLGDIFIILGE